ncbi:hypothetical protein [Chromobacterium sp. IIBBL 290-4]|uniref:hypothetical protein n=1 Tax=Chromobacterium sp. IIBBL 290-4 TaxID=2953890 RepID=UPI0020B7298C|nr:hypothetical protein [Chromobacterium sp. IIBBL 290-4]UTH75786.1 hypothetical protein NKT35_06710 [Chromobacterium sp. IIBBL 290-4]
MPNRRGTVEYWRCDDLAARMLQLEGLGARPMVIENGLSMCQLQDPWGNLIGLRGHSSSIG